MAGASVRVGKGSTLTFGTSGFTSQFLSYRITGMGRESLPTTHMGSTAASTNQYGGATFMPSDIVDAGSIEVEMHYDPDKLPPIGAAVETITFTFKTESGDSTGTILSGSGFATSFDAEVPMDKTMATLTIKCTGVWTRTAAT